MIYDSNIRKFCNFCCEFCFLNEKKCAILTKHDMEMIRISPLKFTKSIHEEEMK